MALKVRALILRNETFGDLFDQQTWGYDQMARHPGRRKNWISFDALAYNPADDCVYCGVTDFSNDIFYRYHRGMDRFEGLNFPSIADPYDAKFHRSLELDDDGVFWAATALLHDVDRFEEAPGGSIVRYDTKTGKLEKVCVPLPHLYIQSLVLDKERRLLHGVTFTPEKLFTYGIETGEVIDHGPIGSGIEMAQPERPVLDFRGRLWCTWGVTRAFMDSTGSRPIRLLCLDPDVNTIRFYDHGIEPLGRYDKGRVDGMLAGRDGHVYMGSSLGALYRLDPETAKVTYLGKPVPGERMAGMACRPDGTIYLACGRPSSHLVRFSPGPDTFEILGPIRDDTIGDQAFQIHDMCIAADGTIYAGENDNFRRSGFLWECRIA
jgi:sugar lactone lactonase YvrE